MQNKRRIIIFVLVVLLLLIPFLAMQFTSEVNWTLSDFLVAGVLLFGTGLLIELAFRKL
jgi:protein-S-isoprenylcysteine O-methyltransferase Ste14